MRINEVKKKEINATLSADELVLISNVMYFYERFHQHDPNAGKPSAKFHEFNAEVIVGRDLCQYGHLDNHALALITEHKHKANPNAGLVPQINELVYPSMDLSQFYPTKPPTPEGGETNEP